MKKNLYLLLFGITMFSNCAKDGQEGKKSLIDLITEPASANCANGGYKVVTGIDANNNNILDPSEIQDTKYICNGSTGATGATGGTGKNSLISAIPEPAGANCATGGYKINTGIDLNGNSVLDNNEIQNSQYVCNGANGLNYLISINAEAAGPNCPYGGYSFNTGIDLNKNGILDNTEVMKTDYICNNSALSEVRLPLDFSANTSSTTPVSGLAVSNFNLANYTGMASVVFTTRLYTTDGSNNAIADLINMTDNIVWDDSRLSSNSTFATSSYLTSPNLINDIPNKVINIGLRLKSDKQGAFAAMYGTSYLILTPKK